MYNQLLITLQLEDKMVYFYIIFWYTFMLLFTQNRTLEGQERNLSQN